MTNEQLNFLLDQIRANLNQLIESLELELLEVEGIKRNKEQYYMGDSPNWKLRDSNSVVCLNQLKEYIATLNI